VPGELVPAAQQSLALERTEPTPMEIVAAIARDVTVPVERLSALLDFQERLEARESEKAFNAAFAQAMMEMPRVVKRGKKDMGGKGVIAYETYEDLDAAIRPIETRYGFARSFQLRPAPEGKAGSVMTLRLTHRAGHSITSERLCRPDAGPGRNDTQAEGSGESYGRRYLTKAVWNIVTIGADDDGNSADPISEQQAWGLQDMLNALAMTPGQAEKFWGWVGPPAVNVATIQRKDYDRIAAWLKQRVKAVQGGK